MVAEKREQKGIDMRSFQIPNSEAATGIYGLTAGDAALAFVSLDLQSRKMYSAG